MQGLHYAQVNGNFMSYTLPIFKIAVVAKSRNLADTEAAESVTSFRQASWQISRVTIGLIGIDHYIDFGGAIQLEPQFESVPFT